MPTPPQTGANKRSSSPLADTDPHKPNDDDDQPASCDAVEPPISSHLAKRLKPATYEAVKPSISSPQAKRLKSSKEPEPEEKIFHIDTFLKLCCVPSSDHKTRHAIQEHRLHHWSVFKMLSIGELKDMGFPIGTALLLTRGVSDISIINDSYHLPLTLRSPLLTESNDMDMDSFLLFCHIPINDHKTRLLIHDHQLHHWSVFEDLSIPDLKEMGFSIGPALLIARGTSQVKSKLATKSHM
jgi:hypothetical protein